MAAFRYEVLFLCTGNSARSIMAEVLLNHWGKGRFRAHSAGSHPRGSLHPLTLRVLKRAGHSTSGLRSKSWNEFAGPAAPRLDFIFTVCDNAAKEACPTWPGHPATARWGVDDPAAIDGSEEDRLRAFERALKDLEARIKHFVSLDAVTLRSQLPDRR